MNIQTRESLKSLACHVLDLALMDGSTRRRFAHSTVHGKQCPIKNVILPPVLEAQFVGGGFAILDYDDLLTYAINTILTRACHDSTNYKPSNST